MKLLLRYVVQNLIIFVQNLIDFKLDVGIFQRGILFKTFGFSSLGGKLNKNINVAYY